MTPTPFTLQDVRLKVSEMLAQHPEGDTISTFILIMQGEESISSGIVGEGQELSFILHKVCHGLPEFASILKHAYISYLACEALAGLDVEEDTEQSDST